MKRDPKEMQFPHNHLGVLGVDKMEPFFFSSDLPVTPTAREVPVIAVNRWVLKDSPKRLTKRYQFSRARDRADFVHAVIEHEITTKHPLKITAEDDQVTVSLVTAGIEDVTEVDYECAKHFDLVFRDLVTRQR